MKKTELSSIGRGVITELFDEEFRKVLTNIADENTEAKAERSVTIKIAIKPDKTRRTGEVKVQAYSTLAKIKPAESYVFFDVDEGGTLAAFEDDPGPELPGINEKPPVQFPRASEG
ncbi:MAG: hypothetical protein LBU19_06050 [Treponema sp.]|jgi:hypothetical protein|nr:hypothetical protein [Treponema sp.]